MTPFIVKRGQIPSSPSGKDGKYNQLRQALLDAAVNEWLYVDVVLDDAERTRAALNAQRCPLGRMIRQPGFRVQTAVRHHSHDLEIPTGIARVYFRKVRE